MIQPIDVIATGSDHESIAAALEPTAPAERIELLDILRGFALFGILLVNMEFFASPMYERLFEYGVAGGWFDRPSVRAVRVLATGKFYPLFSFLFGYGMGLQMERAAARGARFVPMYARRLFALVVIGFAHGLLLWSGDILLTYAILGFVTLLLFRRRKNKTLVIWAVILLCVPALVLAVLCGVVEVAGGSPEAAAELNEKFAEAEREQEASARQAMQLYAHGSLWDVFARRFSDLRQVWFYLLFMAPSVLAMFLLGLVASRKDLLRNATVPPTMRKRLPVVFGVVLASGVLTTVLAERVNWVRPTWTWVVVAGVDSFAAPVQSACYVAFIALLLGRARPARWLGALAPAGRAALSNYLLQSLVVTTICFSYGLGLYGRIRPVAGIVLTVAIFATQVLLSRWWFHRFTLGPAEWLWRTWTYRRAPALRRA